MKYQARVTFTVWQEALSEIEAIQVVLENIPEMAFGVRTEVVGEIKNPVELEPEEEKQNEAH